MADGRPMTVLHVIPHLHSGGVENQLRKVVRLYDRKWFHPIVCCLREKGEVGEAIEKEGVPVFVLNRMRGHTFDFQLIGLLRRFMSEFQVTIVRTHQFHANLYGRIAAIRAGVPIILPSFHCTYAKRKRHRSLLNWYLAGWSDQLIAVSQAVQEDLVRYDHVPAEKVRVIRNGCEIERFMKPYPKEALRAAWKIPPDAPVIGSVNRLVEGKGLELLVQAVHQLRSDYPNLYLLIVGEGPQKRVLEEEVRRLGLADRVILTGLQKEVPAFLSMIDLFVFPSLAEGFSNALLEAMAAGKPVIASDIPGNAEILSSEKIGRRVRPNDAAALAQQIRSLLKSPREAAAMGRQAQGWVASHFTDALMMGEIEGLYRMLLEQKGILK